MHFVRYQLPALLWFLIIFFLSSLPGSDFPTINIPNIDKIAHVCIFFVLCALVDRAVSNQKMFPRLTRRHLFAAIGIVIVYGMTDEFHQMYIPERTADILDLTADAVGGGLYILFFLARTRLRARPRDDLRRTGGPEQPPI